LNIGDPVTTGTVPAPDVELLAPVSPAGQRLALQDQGWRSLSDASDTRRTGGIVGAEVTITHFPQFAGLGVPTRMIRDGRHDAPTGAGFTEHYRFSGSCWIPS
jgi:hypothetical protein